MQANILSQLKDIQTPEPIGWWPLAWGWYVVFGLLLVGLIVFIRYWQRRKRQLVIKKAALIAMAKIENEPLPMTTVRCINDILKRAVLGYAQRQDVANITGEQWANILNDLAPEDAQISPNLLNLAYQPKCSAKDADEYFQQAQTWIQKTLPITATDVHQKLREEGHNV